MEKFISLFKEAVDIDHDVNASDNFREYDEWDSLAYLSIIAMIDEEYGTQIEESEFKKLNTIKDLFESINR